MKTDDINRMIQQTEENLKKQKEHNSKIFESPVPAPKKIYEVNRVSKGNLEKGKNP